MQHSTSGTRPSVVAPGATVEKLAGDFQFTEGPTCDEEGNLFFTDQPNDRILKWSAERGLSTFLQPAGRANGMYFDYQGNLIACADETNALWSIAPDGAITVILSEYKGKPLNGPNDVWVRPDGALYFTDPFYQRPWWTHDTMPQDGQHVYFLSADRRELVRVADDLRAAQRHHWDAGREGHSMWQTSAPGRPTASTSRQMVTWPKTLTAEQGSDGMTLDNEGNLYLTGNGVEVFDVQADRSTRSRYPRTGRRT